MCDGIHGNVGTSFWSHLEKFDAGGTLEINLFKFNRKFLPNHKCHFEGINNYQFDVCWLVISVQWYFSGY